MDPVFQCVVYWASFSAGGAPTEYVYTVDGAKEQYTHRFEYNHDERPDVARASRHCVHNPTGR